MSIIFVSGIHAVGKSTLCSQLSQQLNLPHYSCSKLIKTNSSYVEKKKQLDEIDGNQDVLIKSLARQVSDKHFILDGHFCLVNKSHGIVEVAKDTFTAMQPSLIINITESPEIVHNRLLARGDDSFSLKFIHEFMNAESNRASYIASLLEIPICNHGSRDDISHATQAIKQVLSQTK